MLAAAGRNTRPPARRRAVGLRLLGRSLGPGGAQSHGSMPDDVPHDSRLRWAAGRCRASSARQVASLLRRWISTEQAGRRPAVLAHPSDGWRIPGCRIAGHRKGNRRREHHFAKRQFAGGAGRGRRGVEAVAAICGAITPFPGGVAHSGSKVGSRYKKLKASTADAFCPTLRDRVETQLHADANFAYEIVIDGVNEQTVGGAMAAAMRAAAGPNVAAISAGNYGGKLGKFHFHLHELLAELHG